MTARYDHETPEERQERIREGNRERQQRFKKRHGKRGPGRPRKLPEVERPQYTDDDPVAETAQSIVDELARNTKASEAGAAALLDPATAVNLAMAILDVIQNCRKSNDPATMRATCRSPKIIHRFAVRRALTDHMGREFLSRYGREAVDAVLRAGASASPQSWDTTTAQLEQLSR